MPTPEHSAELTRFRGALRQANEESQAAFQKSAQAALQADIQELQNQAGKQIDDLTKQYGAALEKIAQLEERLFELRLQGRADLAGGAEKINSPDAKRVRDEINDIRATATHALSQAVGERMTRTNKLLANSFKRNDKGLPHQIKNPNPPPGKLPARDTMKTEDPRPEGGPADQGDEHVDGSDISYQ